jgi:hypothetical protein
MRASTVVIIILCMLVVGITLYTVMRKKSKSGFDVMKRVRHVPYGDPSDFTGNPLPDNLLDSCSAICMSQNDTCKNTSYRQYDPQICDNNLRGCLMQCQMAIYQVGAPDLKR